MRDLVIDGDVRAVFLAVIARMILWESVNMGYDLKVVNILLRGLRKCFSCLVSYPLAHTLVLKPYVRENSIEETL